MSYFEPRRLLLVTGLSLAVAVGVLPPCARAGAADEGWQVLDASGVRGGLIVHLGCGGGELTAALRAGESYLVHGLDADAETVERARAHIQSLGQYGPVSVARLSGRGLPYADNVVNLLVAEDLGGVAMDEMMRVLAPLGVVCLRQGEQWTTHRKPWPEAIDEWTHYLHDASNNAVAHDLVVASPHHVQWVAEPKWARHHNHLASLSAMVSSGGRLFAILDEGPTVSIELPSKWSLVARDAFSGVLLWKKPVGPWEGHLRPFRSGPPELARRLVAVGQRVYATLGYGRPLECLDAATGDVLWTCDETEGAVEIVCSGGVLYVVAGAIDADQYAESLRRGSASPPPRNKRIHAIDADSGRTLWVKSDAETSELLPTTLCAAGGRLFFHSLDDVLCLEAGTGSVLWRAPRPARTQRFGWSAPTLVACGDVLLCADCFGPAAGADKADEPRQVEWKVSSGVKGDRDSLGELIAFSAEDGSRLWHCPTAQGYNAPADVFVADGLVWTTTVPNVTSTDFGAGRDLRTGEVVRRLDTAAAFTTTHHHRCYRNKATDRFIFLGRTGTELINLAGEPPLRHAWIRGTCQYGVMPSNGLLYLPPHSCACYIQSKLSGFWALAPRRTGEDSPAAAEAERADGDAVFQTGPAYGRVQGTGFRVQNSPLSTLPDWPTYRHDAGRSGSTKAAVTAALEPAWQAELEGRLTSPVVAEGTLLVASIDAHTVHALDAATGRKRWSRTVGGRVDSPPTIHQGRVFFGSADGNVYCLRLADGALAWRRLIAPLDRRIVAEGQVESVWPVTGSVLVHDGGVYCTAGRSSYLDGGMVFCRIDPASGETLGCRRFYSRDPDSGAQPEALVEDVEMPGALPDVLLCDGQNIFWRDKRLDLDGRELEPDMPHLYSSAGLLDDRWWHRTYWIFGTKIYGRASGWAVVANFVPSGRILVLDESTVFGYGRKRVSGGDRGLKDVPLHLFRADQTVTPLPGQPRLKNNNLALTEHFRPTSVTYHWSREVPLVARAMVLAGDVLFVAGPKAAFNEAAAEEPTFDDRRDGLLMAFSADDGQELSSYSLDTQPTFDGVAAAGGRLYLSTVDGRVICMAEDR